MSADIRRERDGKVYAMCDATMMSTCKDCVAENDFTLCSFLNCTSECVKNRDKVWKEITT